MKEPGLDTRHREKNGEISRKHGQTLVGTLRKHYGAAFAPHFKDTDTLSDVLGNPDEPSLTKLFKDRYAGGLVSKITKRVEFRFGEDSDGSPAVWITIVANADLHPPEAKIEALRRAAEALRTDVLNSENKRWPYVQIKTE
jgi:hypothetical protein